MSAALLVLVALVASGACARVEVLHTNLNGDLEALRAAFNRDVGEVRAVLLASPT